MSHEGLHPEPRSRREHVPEEEVPLTPQEMPLFQKAQRVLILAAFCDKHQLTMDLKAFPMRRDAVAQQIRHDAGIEWAQSHAEHEPTLSALYRNFWKSHKDDVLALDHTSIEDCLALIEKMRKTPARIKRTLH